jgi:hypothetical protein
MNGKTSKAKPKMDDVTKPKKATSTDDESASLVIQSRPFIGRATSISSSSESDPQKPIPSTQEETRSAPALPSQSKKIIVPISDDVEKTEAPAKAAIASKETSKEEPKANSPEQDTATGTPKDTNPKETSKPAEAPVKVAETSQEKSVEDTDNDEVATVEQSDKKAAKPSADTEKAVAEAAAATKREHELEGLIDSKQFYVPINAVARKREVKHSALMTICVLLLAFILVDLMLDSGLILLAEKIPHTHYFTVSNINQK